MHLLKSRWVLALGMFAATAASYAQWSNPADDVPAYHPSAPLKVSALPPIMAGAQLRGNDFRYPWQVHVYQQVAKVGNVVYQLPCNCRCDRALGHTSQGGIFCLPADPAGQVSGADSCCHRSPRVRENRPRPAVVRAHHG